MTVRQITLGHGPRAIAALTLAFSGDPAARWSWPDPEVFLENFPTFALALGGAAFGAGSAYADEDFRGAALWLPPGAAADEPALERLFTRSLPADRLSAAFDLFARMAERHPKQVHWHLPLLGVDPTAQGRNLEEQLLRPALACCDADGVLAYLESSNPQRLLLRAPRLPRSERPASRRQPHHHAHVARATQRPRRMTSR